MKLLTAQGAATAFGDCVDVSWREFIQLIYNHSLPVSDETKERKKDSYWFSFAQYKNNHRRREFLVNPVWAVVIDFDGIKKAQPILDHLAQWEYLGWTTWSSTPDALRWRVVIPVEGGVAADEFAQLVEKVTAPIAQYAKIDQRSLFPEQLWFMPEHKSSQRQNHRIWENRGKWLRPPRIITVDFTGVKLVRKAEEVGEGDRNTSLMLRLTEADALRCESREDLIAMALDWNSRLRTPMERREAVSIARKKWDWMQRGEGLIRRADAWKGKVNGHELPDVGVGLMGERIRQATLPPSIVGDFLYPGATMLSAKMKEGKSFLAMQLAISVATGTPFLAGDTNAGFAVKKSQKVVVIAGEDTEGGIASRFLGSIAAGHLSETKKHDDILMVFNDDLDRVRTALPKVPGLTLFESLIQRWYEQGYRLIAIDPLRVVEAALHIHAYPGTVPGMNVHAKDFQTMRYYTKIAQQYDDLCLIISMHHGKNKRDHDAADPGDMIAGTTGFGAGAITTISLLPVADQLNAEVDDEGRVPKRRELYLHGRYTREQRVLIEQSLTTGVWKALGLISDIVLSKARKEYFDALTNLGAVDKYVSAEEVAKYTKARIGAVRHTLNRARKQGITYLGWKLMIKKGPTGGYRMVPSSTVNIIRHPNP